MKKTFLMGLLSLLLAAVLLTLPCTATLVVNASSGGTLKFKDVSCGGDHTAAIAENGDLYVWGDNEFGQVGNGTTTCQTTPIKILSDVKMVSAGEHGTAAITTDGSLYVWGSQDGGDIYTMLKTPTKVMNNVTYVSLGRFCTAAITADRNLYIWKNYFFYDDNASAGTDYMQHMWTDAPYKILEDVTSVSVGCDCAAAITADGSLYVWDESSSLVGNGFAGYQPIPVKILDNVVSASAGAFDIAAITANGDLYMWEDILEDENMFSPEKIMSDVYSINFGANSFPADGRRCTFSAINNQKDLYICGGNYFGQVGNGTTEDQESLIKIMNNVECCLSTYTTTAAITENRDLYVWGSNEYGQVGNGSQINQTRPVKVLSNVAQVSLGYRFHVEWPTPSHTAAITVDGDLYVWGWNGEGQIGNGTCSAGQYTPYKVEISPADIPFTDVNPGDWFYQDVCEVYQRGIMNGVSDTRFSPQGKLSRAHVVTVLYRLDGSPEVSGSSGFDDVPEGWYADAVTWASQNGIVEGVSATRFNPNGNITREQIATILYRYYVEYLGNSPSGYADLNGYIDGDETSAWAEEAVRWAVSAGLIKGISGTASGAIILSPKGTSTRAQVATLMVRLINLGSR